MIYDELPRIFHEVLLVLRPYEIFSDKFRRQPLLRPAHKREESTVTGFPVSIKSLSMGQSRALGVSCPLPRT